MILGNVNTFSELTNYGHNLTQQQEYDMISWLVTQIFTNANSKTPSTAMMAALGGAIWSIADGAGVPPDYVSSGAEADVEDALVYVLGHPDASFYSDYTVYTPNGAPCPQPYTSALARTTGRNSGRKIRNLLRSLPPSYC